jgi:spore maturation protein SpmB
VLVFLLAGAAKRVPVYEVFVEGAKEGFGVAVNIIPYLVAMLVAIGVFRAAGCMDYVMGAIGAAWRRWAGTPTFCRRCRWG